MSALNNDSLLIEKANLWVGLDVGNLVDLGAVRNAEFKGEITKIEVNSDNRGSILDRGRLNGSISFEWLEPANINALNLMFSGIVTKSSVPGSATPVVGEVVTLEKNSPTILANKNGDNTKVSSIVCKKQAGAVLLTLGTDYDVQVINGSTYLLLLNGYSTSSVVCTVDYSYTPATALSLSGGQSLSMTPLYVRLIGPVDTNIDRIIDLKSATIDTELLLAFGDVEQAGDVGKMPVTFKNQKYAEWTFIDQKNTL
jgi:hypothetical protein